MICKFCGKDNRSTPEERSAKLRKAFKKRIAEGLPVGRPRKTFSNPHIKILRDKGLSLREIAREMCVSHRTIHRALKNGERK